MVLLVRPKNQATMCGMEVKKFTTSQKTRKVPSKIKTMLITHTLFDSKVHREFVSIDQTITGAYYLAVLKRLMVRVRRIRPEYRDPETWSLLHDKAPSQTSLIVRQFLARNQVCVLNHPPHSPDLAPCDFSLFPNLELKLKGCFLRGNTTVTA